MPKNCDWKGTKIKYIPVKIFTLIMMLSITLSAAQKNYFASDLTQSNNMMIEANTGKPVNGIAKFFYPSGQLKYEVQYKNGVRDGATKHYDESGQLKSLYTYKNGQRNGTAKVYAKSGYSVAEYINDTAVRGTIYSSDGTRSSPMTQEQLAILSRI